MKGKNGNKNLQDPQAANEEKNNPEGYPLYPASEDVYSKLHEEANINPEDISEIKPSNEKIEVSTEKDFSSDLSGDELDIPGAELDDKEENVGSEDEENNFYSLGGDNHNDLEEDQGE